MSRENLVIFKAEVNNLFFGDLSLWMRAGSITSNQRGTIKAVETPRFSTSHESQDCDVHRKGDGRDTGHIITRAYYTDLLRQLQEKIKQIQYGDLKKECSYTNIMLHTHIYSGHGCYPEMWIPSCRTSTLFS